MVRAEGVELQQGAAPWMRLAHLAASLLAATAVLTASASLSIKLLLLVSVCFVDLAAERRMRRAVASCAGELSSPIGRAPRRANHAET